tara:strand:- start:68 stop:1453 length:1386 start_codon:yes stop_codon:yes gene_type:complete
MFKKVLILYSILIITSFGCLTINPPSQGDEASNTSTTSSDATIAALNSAIEALQISQKEEAEKTKVDDSSDDNLMIVEVPTPTPVKKYMVATPTPKVSVSDKITSLFETNHDLAERIVSANKVLQGGQIKESIRLCSEILKDILDSKDPELELLVNGYFDRGYAYYLDGQYQNAIDDYILVKDLLNGKTYWPRYFNQTIRYTDVLSNIGQIYNWHFKDYRRALDVLNDLVESDPNYVEGWAQRGMVYVQLEEFRTGLDDMEKAKSFGPLTDDADRVYYFSGVAHFEIGERTGQDELSYQLAINEFNKSEAVLSDDAWITINDIRNGRAWAYLRLGQFTQAEADLIKIPKTDPLYIDSLNGLGSVYLEQEKYDLAIETYDKMIKEDPFDARAIGNRGLSFDRKGDWRSALKDYNKAIALGTDWASYYYSRGLIYQYNMNDYQTALEDYREACKLDTYYCDKY